PDLAPVQLPGPVEFICRIAAHPQAAPDSPKVFGIIGHHMRAPEVMQLYARFERAEKLVCVLHGGSVPASDVAAVDECLQCLGGGRAAQTRIGSPVPVL